MVGYNWHNGSSNDKQAYYFIPHLYYNFHIQVFLSTRRGAWVTGKVGDTGLPIDVLIGNRWMNFLLKFMPTSVFNDKIEEVINKRFDHVKFGLKVPIFVYNL